jgi:hypothetical protein
MRTYDWPGMSSPEVVKASRESGHSWQRIVHQLKPDWLVLRPHEAVYTLHGMDADNSRDYELVKTFDVTRKLEKLELQGKGLLAFDGCFFVFHRRPDAP